MERYSDGLNGRCAIGVIMSYFGWDGNHDSDITTCLQAALPTLSNGGLCDDFFIIELNDSDMIFDEIAEYLDKIDNSRRPKLCLAVSVIHILFLNH
jgi:hypothetical protein